MGGSDDDDGGWSPVILSMAAPTVQSTINAALEKAKAKKVPGAHKVKVTVKRVSAVKVSISGVHPRTAKTLGLKHFEPGLRKRRARIKR